MVLRYYYDQVVEGSKKRWKPLKGDPDVWPAINKCHKNKRERRGRRRKKSQGTEYSKDGLVRVSFFLIFFFSPSISFKTSRGIFLVKERSILQLIPAFSSFILKFIISFLIFPFYPSSTFTLCTSTSLSLHCLLVPR